jgi:hypothetical protein
VGESPSHGRTLSRSGGGACHIRHIVSAGKGCSWCPPRSDNAGCAATPDRFVAVTRAKCVPLLPHVIPEGVGLCQDVSDLGLCWLPALRVGGIG